MDEVSSSREERERRFSRRELLRAGMVVPVALAVPAVVAGCSSGSGGLGSGATEHGDHTDAGSEADAAHVDSVHTDTGNSSRSRGGHTDTSHTDTTHDDTGHGDTTHDDTAHSDSLHADAHDDVPHNDENRAAATHHSDFGGPHQDTTSRGVITFTPPHEDLAAFTDHSDSGPHGDGIVIDRPASHGDSPHGDTD